MCRTKMLPECAQEKMSFSKEDLTRVKETLWVGNKEEFTKVINFIEGMFKTFRNI